MAAPTTVHVPDGAMLEQAARNIIANRAGRLESEAAAVLAILLQGAVLALASPEWMAGAMREAGVSPALLADRLAGARRFIAQHPIAFAAPEAGN